MGLKKSLTRTFTFRSRTEKPQAVTAPTVSEPSEKVFVEYIEKILASEPQIATPVLQLPDLGDLTFGSINLAQYHSQVSPRTLTLSPESSRHDLPIAPACSTILRTPSSSPSSPSCLDSSPSLKISLDDFILLRQLGKGGQGRVVLVKHVITGAGYALKIIKKNNGPLNSSRRVFEEMDIIRRSALADEPWFVGLRGSFHDSDYFFLLTEYAPKGDLSMQMARGKMIPPDLVLHYSAEIVQILTVLHDSYHIIHRDFKPENLLISSTGHLILADFGISRLFRLTQSDLQRPWASSCQSTTDETVGRDTSDAERRLERERLQVTRKICGSPGYMAPELFTGPSYSYQVDVWAAGVMLYKMMVGKLPFGLDRKQSTKELYRRTTTLPLEFLLDKEHPGLSPDARDLIGKMLQRDPFQRPPARDLRAHPYFQSIDWDTIESMDNPGPGMNARVPTRKNKQPVAIPSGKAYEAADDPFPWFTWVAPNLENVADLEGSGADNDLDPNGWPAGLVQKVRKWGTTRKLI